MSERYQVRGRVGRGGMSAVYRAYDSVMGRDVALKRLLPVEETNLNEAAGGVLAREAAALARFSHPNVVTVFAFEEDEEGPFVVMELVEGEDLHTVMKSGALSWEDFRHVAEQCLEPLVSAGDLNLLHRDIKPGNIMLTVTPSGRFLVKLLDFGLAKFSQQPSLQTLDQRGSFLGSIDFIAPEQLELRPLDQRTDLYSLGCVFYYMLAQESPFSGGNPAETSMNHIRHRCKPIGELREDIPPLVADWIMRLVSRLPEDRPTDAREALSQYLDALKGIPYTAGSWEGKADEVPFAKIAETPPPSGPVAPPTGAVGGTRVIRTASGPIPTGRKTDSVTGAQSPRSTTRQPHLPAAGTTSQRGFSTGPHRGRTAEPTPRKESDSTRKPPWRLIAGGVGIFIALIAVFLLFGGRGDNAVSNPTTGEGSTQGAALSPLPYPETLPTSDGQPNLPPLPVEENLFARFAASKGVYGRDYRKVPAIGDTVAVWVNLAIPTKERSLLRDPGDAKGEHLPFFIRYAKGDLSGLGQNSAGIVTTNRSSLTMLKHEAGLPFGCTIVAVMRVEAGDDRLLRIQAPVWDNRYVQLSTGYDGKVNAVQRGKTDGPEERISVPWTSGEVGVFTYVWNPKAKEQRLVCRSGTTGVMSEAKGAITFEGGPLGVLSIGRRGFGDGFDSRTGNVLLEIVVYDRVLTEPESGRVADSLAARYLAKP